MLIRCTWVNLGMYSSKFLIYLKADPDVCQQSGWEYTYWSCSLFELDTQVGWHKVNYMYLRKSTQWLGPLLYPFTIPTFCQNDPNMPNFGIGKARLRYDGPKYVEMMIPTLLLTLFGGWPHQPNWVSILRGYNPWFKRSFVFGCFWYFIFGGTEQTMTLPWEMDMFIGICW